MASLIQGTILKAQGNEYRVCIPTKGEHTVWSTSLTMNNGWPKVGDHVLIQVNDQQQALVMTRYWCSQSHAA